MTDSKALSVERVQWMDYLGNSRYKYYIRYSSFMEYIHPLSREVVTEQVPQLKTTKCHEKAVSIIKELTGVEHTTRIRVDGLLYDLAMEHKIHTFYTERYVRRKREM